MSDPPMVPPGPPSFTPTAGGVVGAARRDESTPSGLPGCLPSCTRQPLSVAGVPLQEETVYHFSLASGSITTHAADCPHALSTAAGTVSVQRISVSTTSCNPESGWHAFNSAVPGRCACGAMGIGTRDDTWST